MSEDNSSFDEVEFVIEAPKSKYVDDKKVPAQNNISKHYNEIQNKQSLNPSIILSDRKGQLPTQEELQEIQNRIMGRSANFSKLSREEKEKIMFEEIQNWHFSNMPSIEEMEENRKKEMIVQVDSLNKADLYGPNKPHINIKSENVKLEIASDGRTIRFNNREVLSQYRDALRNQKDKTIEKQKEIKKINDAQTMHEERVFE